MENLIAKILLVVSRITIVIGVLGFFVIASIGDDWIVIGGIAGISLMISGVFVRGFAEIIELLEQISRKNMQVTVNTNKVEKSEAIFKD